VELRWARVARGGEVVVAVGRVRLEGEAPGQEGQVAVQAQAQEELQLALPACCPRPGSGSDAAA